MRDGIAPRPARLGDDFYRRDALVVAPDLLGKVVCRRDDAGVIRRGRIVEAEVYRGEEDTACHARFGRTKRAEVLYLAGGVAYVYLCYGIHRMLNVVTGPGEMPQAVLIRALAPANHCGQTPMAQPPSMVGPGRLTKALGITLDDNRADLRTSSRLWIEDDGNGPENIMTSPRIGIGYASAQDQARLWRFTVS